ncbi:uncharacterized protein F5891DRAFT_1281289 [Suillus fuscotomentosus]|uniref:Uncharacterized protein n=1 Tax=Suillus fuscotomentosus TaxID=1912939 RepID=A0AAD4HG03_9AGAM|nr:uncharacterized protein F5891DRAFT_1281289 [Suillus fuscotomentosus]KAG1895122.1 hypothetical protein F5891DRAFT_1281289 [Suillus fuscotomentosus]
MTRFRTLQQMRRSNPSVLYDSTELWAPLLYIVAAHLQKLMLLGIGYLFNVRPIRMTLEQLLRTREKPSPVMARYPDEYGGGYMATVEFIHQLHCIDMLRRASWSDKYSDHDDHDTPENYRIHLDHCIEILRQNIMCRGDVTILTYDWVEGVEDPFPNFNTPHRCRNFEFEKVVNWVDEHCVFVPKSKMYALRITWTCLPLLDCSVDIFSPNDGSRVTRGSRYDT